MRKTQRWADGSSVSDVLAKLEELWGPMARLLAGILEKKKTQVERLDAERRLGPSGKVLLAGGVRFPPVETATLRAVRREAVLWKARLQGCPTLGPKRRRTGSRNRDREWRGFLEEVVLFAAAAATSEGAERGAAVRQRKYSAIALSFRGEMPQER